MTNESTLQKIYEFVRSKNLSQMKKWELRTRFDSSNRRPKLIRKYVRQIRELLNLVSGNDIIELLKDVLTTKEREKLATTKYKDALTNLSEYYKKTPLKQRHNIARPLKDAKLKLKQVKRLGFRVSRHLWKTCDDSTERNCGGGQHLPDYLRTAISNYLREKSSIASNRLVTIKEKINGNLNVRREPARYLEDRKIELYKSFPMKDDVALSTFYKYARSLGIYKNPFRLTDLCEYCEELKQLKRKIDVTLSEENYEIGENYQIEKMVEDFSVKLDTINQQLTVTQDLAVRNQLNSNYNKYKEIIDDLEDYDCLWFHKNISRCQRLAYNKYRKNVDDILRNKVMIEIDFKQKIVIGLSPRQINNEYYNQKIRSCLGFGIYYIDNNNQVQVINFDIITSELKQDGMAAVRGFRILRHQEFFKNIDKNQYIVWADCGKHFRCKYFIGYLLGELADEKIHVNLNFFCDKHGKSSRDAHFSMVSRFIRDESLVKKLECSQDIVDAILKRQNMSNENKQDNTKEVKTYALALEAANTHDNTQYQTIAIKNVESYYNYQTKGDDFQILTTILSNQYQLMDIEFAKEYENSGQSSFVGEEPVVALPINVTNAFMKKYRINSAVNKIKSANEAANINTNTNLYQYFSVDCSKDMAENDVNNNNNLVVVPNTCRDQATRTKPSCVNCAALCTFTLKSILHPRNPIGQVDILEELTNHNHPKSRLINKKQRNTAQAARELADHYIFAHNRKEPKLY